MGVSFSHSVTFPDPMMSTISALSPNTLALTTGCNLPFLFYTFQNLNPRLAIQYGGCSADDIAGYTKPCPEARSQSSKADATRWLTNFLVDQWPSQKVQDALDNIGQVLRTPVWGPEMLVQITRDLDTAFFDGRLRDTIQVSWEDVHTFLGPNIIKVLGYTTFDGGKNICKISLNRYAIQCGPTEPRMQTVQTLIHEMVVSSNMTKPHETVLTVV